MAAFLPSIIKFELALVSQNFFDLLLADEFLQGDDNGLGFCPMV